MADPSPPLQWERVLDHPAWRPYRAWVERLPADRFPSDEDLSSLLTKEVMSHDGHTIRFLAPDDIAKDSDATYEEEIANTGRVNTRPGSLHDLRNALVWTTFPATKAALNHRHVTAPEAPVAGRRGPLRDALTLFDECGAIVTSTSRESLEHLARHDWNALFGPSGDAWPREMQVQIVGHGTLEQLWRPYKAITVRCLLMHTPAGTLSGPSLDRAVSRCWSDADGVQKPSDLCPLPIMGIPGWWTGAQDAGFYADSGVFRPPRANRIVPPIYPLSD